VELAAVWEPVVVSVPVVRSELAGQEAAAALVVQVEVAVRAVQVNKMRVVISVNSTQLKVREATASANKSLMRAVANRVIQTNLVRMTMETISKVAGGKTLIRATAVPRAAKVARAAKAAKVDQPQLAEVVQAEVLAPAAEVVLEEAAEAAEAAHRAA
jgi:hypothetical protein